MGIETTVIEEKDITSPFSIDGWSSELINHQYLNQTPFPSDWLQDPETTNWEEVDKSFSILEADRPLRFEKFEHPRGFFSGDAVSQEVYVTPQHLHGSEWLAKQAQMNDLAMVERLDQRERDNQQVLEETMSSFREQESIAVDEQGKQVTAAEVSMDDTELTTDAEKQNEQPVPRRSLRSGSKRPAEEVKRESKRQSKIGPSDRVLRSAKNDRTKSSEAAEARMPLGAKMNGLDLTVRARGEKGNSTGR